MAHLFDSQLRLWSLITNPGLLDCFDELEAEVLGWDNTSIGLHKYGGTQYNYKGKEIGHIHSNGILDIRLSRKIKNQLMAEGRIDNHHIFENTGWISFYIRHQSDNAYAKKLLKIAYLNIK